MKSDRPLYLVASRPGATGVVRTSQPQLRLVRPAAASVLVEHPPAHVQRPRRSLSRPFGQRVVQAAGDVAVFAVALIVGLRPSA